MVEEIWILVDEKAIKWIKSLSRNDDVLGIKWGVCDKAALRGERDYLLFWNKYNIINQYD